MWSLLGSNFRTPGQSDAPGRLLVADTSKSWTEQKPETLPVSSPPGGSLEAWAWSSDGRRLAVDQILSDGRSSGIFVYDFNSRQLQKVTDFGISPLWLEDCRRLLFAGREKLYLTDVATKRLREVLSVPSYSIPGLALSRDNRLIVFLMPVTEADVWLVSLQ